MSGYERETSVGGALEHTHPPRPRSPAAKASPPPEEGKKKNKKKKKVEAFPHHPGLVGSIVEKGFSSDLTPPRPPQPSVLAFPVARHRSHGPHWAPVGVVDGAEEEDAEDDQYGANYDPIATLAKVPRRKERKGLDFSRWREFMGDEAPKGNNLDAGKVKTGAARAGDGTLKMDSGGNSLKGENLDVMKAKPDVGRLSDGVLSGCKVSAVVGREEFEMGSGGDGLKKENLVVTKMEAEVGRVSDGVLNGGKAAEEKEEFESRKKGDDLGPSCAVAVEERGTGVEEVGAMVGKEKGEVGISKCGSLDSSLVVSHADVDARMEVGEVGAPSLVDEIDTENRACLGKMSQEEIAEAQAEIMERMSPAVLEMLKKRGRDKMGGRRSAGASNKNDIKKVVRSGGGEDNNGKLEGPKQAEGTKVSRMGGSLAATSELLRSSVHDSSTWRAWSERVEKVRGLRFSLDGNLIASASSEEQMDACCQYTPGNVTERDYLRTEGDPGAAGYTIKEAVALVRSMVPAQRSFALHLLASVLDKALSNFHQQNARYAPHNTAASSDSVDWQAVWAYALGPEPEIGLVLRIALDDNHNSVVLACTKVIQCLLCCDLNEVIFNILEKSPMHSKDTCTAPVFRSRPEIGCGFLHGGFWKYSTKPSNILPVCKDDEEDEYEGKPTIRDDVVVAGQDLAAGLVRMGILPRICYLLEMDPSPPLDEYLVSILVALARHSPTCSLAVIRCPRLVQTIFDRFTKLTSLENLPYQTETIILLKVLSEAGKQHCLDFINRGIFQRTMSQWYRNTLSLDDSIHSEKEQCKLTCALMVQQLRFWKVCIRYGYCLSYFSDFFPAMCFWLSPPTFSTLIKNNILGEFAAVTTEAFFVLEALSRRLPCVHSLKRLDKPLSSDDGQEIWSWSHVVPMVELAMNWLTLQKSFDLKSVGSQKMSDNEEYAPSAHIFWVISAVMHMLSSVINRISPDTVSDMRSYGMLPWLPDFVPKIGLSVVKSGFLNFVDSSNLCVGGQYTADSSLFEYLCQLRDHNGGEASLASVCCLHGLVELINSMDKIIQRAKCSNSNQPLERYNLSMEDNILLNGIAKCAHDDLVKLFNKFVNLAGSSWQTVQSIEMFGRGGPAPGVGLGWGSSGGGFWSLNVLQTQVDSWLLQSLYKIFPIVPDKDISISVAVSECPIDRAFPIWQKINSVIGICLVAGPNERSAVERAIKMLLQVPVFRSLAMCIRHLLQSNKKFKPANWQLSDEDYILFSKALGSHFHSRWLTAKKKSREKKEDGCNLDEACSEKKEQLETIPEDVEMLEASDVCQEGTPLHIEWAHQRLPLPAYWFLSPLCTVSDPEAAWALYGSSNVKIKGTYSSGDPTEVVRGGLLFLLGLEAMSYFLSMRSIYSPILHIPLVWKLHALSMMLIIKLDVLDDVRFRDIFETLQTLYGQRLQESINEDVKPNGKSLASLHQYLEAGNHKQVLDFQKQVHESYNTFTETFVEHFASVSYGDVAFGRQVAVYLHRSIDSVTRLAAWNTLSNAHVLDLLPPLGNCISEAGGYLESIEDNEAILEAYAKSWTSGALNRAATQPSMSFALALHHLSRFILHECAPDKSLLRNRLVKSLLRGLSQKPNQQRMMMDLVKYDKPLTQDLYTKNKFTSEGELTRRLAILSEGCEGNSSLLAELEKLKSLLTV